MSRRKPAQGMNQGYWADQNPHLGGQDAECIKAKY